MNKLINKSWIFILLWSVVLLGVLFSMPEMGKLVREKGQVEIGAKYSYSVAQNILKKLNSTNEDDSVLDVLIIYHNPQSLSQHDLDSIKSRIDNLEDNKKSLGITKIQNVFKDKDLEDMVVSKDRTTLLVPVSIEKQARSIEAIREDLSSQIKAEGLKSYTIGADFILEDFIKSVEAGVQKTELITIICIVLILMLVFRSPVTPFVSLATVGVSFLTSLYIVLHLVDKYNFTISNFTNIFLILVLFGIGTDYTMLLLMRFKEELYKGHDKNTAIINTYKTAGKTVLISSLTIFIGFTCLFFSQFKIYKSGSAVAVGIGVLIIMLFTFLPGLMKLFGKYIFWSPFKVTGHADSKVWEKVSSLSTKYPYFALLFVLAVCSSIFFYSSDLSYNNLKEVDKSYSSVKVFDIVSEHFSVGKALPATLVIQNPTKMNNPYTLSEIDDITETLKSIKGVEKVYSVTQPKGEKIKKLYINDQTAVLKNGLQDATDGVDKISTRMDHAKKQIDSSIQGKEPIDALQKGAHDLAANITLVNKSVNKLNDGMGNGAKASKDLEAGVANIDTSMGKLNSSIVELKNGYSQLGLAYNQVGDGLGQLLEQTRNFQTAFGGIITMQHKLEADHPELSQDTTFITMKQTSAVLYEKLQQMIDGITKLNSVIVTANTSLEQANKGLDDASKGISAMKKGTSKLKQGSHQMSPLLSQAAQGEEQIAEALEKLQAGSLQLEDGQGKLIDGINNSIDESKKLSSGLSKAHNGLSDISEGLKEADSYIKKLSNSKTSKTFFIPQDKINSGDFVKSMDLYMSDDKSITKIDVVLNIDPYSEEAMDTLRQINDTVSAKIKSTSLKNSIYGISGTTQMNVDLKTMSENDFNFVRIIMLAGIMLVLMFVTRDFWMSIFIMLSLVASYYIAISVSSVIFTKLLGIGDLTWNVPFFSFIMIIALGVDYSIFLVLRHRENKDLPLTESIVLAAKNIGGVIFSAGILLSATFAAMYPSGVLTLMQLSVTVIIGIMLLCSVFLPIFIPALTAIKAKAMKEV